MRRIFIILLLSTFNFQLSTLFAQTYVWKAGKPLVVNPDSITFVEPDTRLQIYHSQQDDVVPFGNSRELFRFFQNQGCNNVTIDSVSLNLGHETSGMMFIIALMKEFEAL